MYPRVLLSFLCSFARNAIIPIGYPNVDSKSGRTQLERIVHNEMYDISKYRSSRQIVEDLAKRRVETVKTYRTTQEQEEVKP
jgi:hypothetical protein